MSVLPLHGTRMLGSHLSSFEVDSRVAIVSDYGVDEPEFHVYRWVKSVLPAFLLLPLYGISPLLAVNLEQLDSAREWRTRDLTISGNNTIAAAELREMMSTKTRPWYAQWRPRPLFDPAVFASDLERLVRFYQDKGYFETKVSYDLEVDGAESLVSPRIDIIEGNPIKVAQVSVDILDASELQGKAQELIAKLPLREDEAFAVDAYQQSESALKEFFYDQGRARVEVTRKAQVVLDRHEARVVYTIEVGPETKFGTTLVEGLKDVDEKLVLRELTYTPGEPFSGRALKDSERNLRQLDLFSLIRIEPQPADSDPRTVAVKITVEEKPPREIMVGIGYETEEGVRGQLRWRHNNWLGGGRKLEVGAKVSQLARELDVNFLQPFFFGPDNRFLVTFAPQQFTEPGYTLTGTRLRPKIERKFSDHATGILAYRLDYGQLNDVSTATTQSLKKFVREGWLSGLSAGLLWNTANDPLNPTTGQTLSVWVEQAGRFLGGDFDLYRLQGELKGYYPLAEKTVLAYKLKTGFVQPTSGTKEVPLFERYYAGGGTSVRGYGRSRLGPLSASDDPVGGRSLIEGSVEFRRALWNDIGVVVFIDFGQVSVRSFDLPVDNLKFSAGLGIRYTTPIGPLRLDFGFPFKPPANDRPWQIHFSVGQSF